MLKAFNQSKKITGDRLIQLFHENNKGVFVVRYRKPRPFGQEMFGFDCFETIRHEDVNSGEISFRLIKSKTNAINFEPDENNIPIAYVVNTVRNKKILAEHIYSPIIDVVMLANPEGVIPGAVIKEELRKMAEAMGIKHPTPNSSYDQLIRKNQEDLQNQNDALAMIGKSSNPLSPEDAERVVYKKYDGLIKFLKDQNGDGWRKTKEYKSVIKPEIEKLMGEGKDAPETSATPAGAPAASGSLIEG